MNTKFSLTDYLGAFVSAVVVGITQFLLMILQGVKFPGTRLIDELDPDHSRHCNLNLFEDSLCDCKEF